MTRLNLPETLRNQVEQWACAGYPSETCGLLLGRRSGVETEVTEALLARNIDLENASHRYEVDPQDYLMAHRRARTAGLDIVGVWHSHPDYPAQPSLIDLENGLAGWSYVIVSVTRRGVTDLRSWRLDGDRFVEEEVTTSGP